MVVIVGNISREINAPTVVFLPPNTGYPFACRRLVREATRGCKCMRSENASASYASAARNL